MLAKLPGEIRIKESEDVTKQYLLLSNSHDGRSALRVYFTPIRVVCANTLGVAERRSRGQGVSIMHKGDLPSKVAEAQNVLGFAKRFYYSLDEKINRLASHLFGTLRAINPGWWLPDFLNQALGVERFRRQVFRKLRIEPW